MPWLKIKDEIEAKETKSVPLPEASTGGPIAGQVELGSAPIQTSNLSSTLVPATPAAAPELNFRTKPQATVPVASPTQLVPETDIEGPVPEDEAPDTERSANLPIPLVSKTPILAHQHFYESLESLSKEDPRILAKYISKYASSIQESDPEVAINLFLLVKRIKK
jgi:hypothetical protein